MSTRRPHSGLQIQIVASLFVVVLAGLTIVAVVVGSLALQMLQRQGLERLHMGARHLERVLVSGSGRLADLAAVARTLDERGFGGEWSVYDADGRRLGSRGETAAEDPLRPLALEALRGGDVVRQEGFPSGELALAVGVVARTGARGALVGRVPPARLRAEAEPLLRSGLWVLGMAALVFVAFGSYLLRRRIVLPVRELEGAARRIAEGDLGVRVEASGADELSELARRFSDMAASLERQRAALVEAQRSLAHGERLASVGRLAAGVAHEVGNPVAAILGYAEVCLRDPGSSPRTREGLGRIRDEALRVRSLVRELLDLAGAERLETRAVAPGELVARLGERVRPQPLLTGIALDLEVEEGLPQLTVDPRRTEQLLLNLIENAAHAVRGLDSPRILLAARCARLPERPARRRDDARGEAFVAERRPDGVAFDVVDNGAGIDADDLPHVFDPFFTTKDPGVGTGLGLWNAHRTAELLGGQLRVESVPGRTRFSLILPASDTHVSDGPAADPADR